MTSFSADQQRPGGRSKLSTAYGGDISKVDVFVGGIAEDPVGGGIVGPLFRAMLIDQFTRTRDGDAVVEPDPRLQRRRA